MEGPKAQKGRERVVQPAIWGKVVDSLVKKDRDSTTNQPDC